MVSRTPLSKLWVSLKKIIVIPQILLSNPPLKTGEQFGWSELAIQGVREEMMSSDYKHLVETFDKHFGEVIDLNLAGMEL